jgi:long-chain acyl-CoA synthetase
MQNPTAYLRDMAKPPPPGSPYGVPQPGTARPGRSAIYRHWRFAEEPLATSVDVDIQSVHDILEVSARRYPNHKCLGTRKWNATSQVWEDKFEWISYTDFALRRNNIGRGLREIHELAGQTADKYAVGLWSQNRAEWQLCGKFHRTQPAQRVSMLAQWLLLLL